MRFSGALGRRVGWEVESGLYHACAAVLNLLAGSDTATPVEVVFAHRDGVLRVEATAPGWPWPVDRLRADLADDAARLAVLGGTLECAVTAGVAEVRVRLPERIGLVWTTTAPESSLLDRVRHLVEQGWHAATDRAPWEAVADRLGRPLRLVVVGPGSAAVADALSAGRPAPLRGLAVTGVPGPVDRDMATALTAVWSADAVLCLTPPPPEFRLVLRAAPQRVDLVEATVRPALALFAATVGEDGYRALRRVPPEVVGGLSGDDLRVAAEAARVADGPGDVAEGLAEASGLVALRGVLTRRLVARADLIAARRALVSITGMASGPLRREVDRVHVQAHEIVELDTLDSVEHDLSLPPGLRTEGERLMGLHGVGPRVRLGLAADASDDEVRSAARAAAGRWRVLGEAPGRVREVCEVVVRTCEGLISAAPDR
ncbi:hypothetical protein K7G98_11165 [Saccharothrix sp. MB29]|nr:hypothetical protein [Saccharothrix sp. MB29]